MEKNRWDFKLKLVRFDSCCFLKPFDWDVVQAKDGLRGEAETEMGQNVFLDDQLGFQLHHLP